MKTVQEQLDEAIARNHDLEENLIEREQYIHVLEAALEELIETPGD